MSTAPNLLVTMAQARRHLRLDDEDSEGDLDLELKVYAASAIVLNYLKSRADAYLDSSGLVIVDSDGAPMVPFEMQAATLLMLGYLHRLRDANDDGSGSSMKAFEQGFLPTPVTAILYSLRDPALA